MSITRMRLIRAPSRSMMAPVLLPSSSLSPARQSHSVSTSFSSSSCDKVVARVSVMGNRADAATLRTSSSMSLNL